MARRKARSVWVWQQKHGFLDTSIVEDTRPHESVIFPENGITGSIDEGAGNVGYVEFREVLPKKRKVKRAKK